MQAGKPKILLAALFLVYGLTAAELLAQERAGPEPGKLAPALSVEQWLEPAGHEVRGWEDLRGKVVVLEFWATWCVPCVEVIPHLNELAKKFENRPVQFISITDEGQAPVAKFLRKEPIGGWVGLDPDRSTFQDYGVEGIPHTVLIGADGSFMAVTNPQDITESALNEILAGNVQEALAKLPKPVSKSDFLAGLRSNGAPSPLFEVLIRPASAQGLMGVSMSPAQFIGRALLVREVITNAYGVSSMRAVIPETLAGRRYDFLVTVPSEQAQSLRKVMQQALETTFGLRVHREMRETDVFVLVAPQGRPPDWEEGPADSRPSLNTDEGRIEARNASVSKLASTLEYSLRRPVVDETGIEGKYEFDLTWNSENPESLLAVVREQLGLELRPAKRAIEFLIVEVPEPPAQH